jgi:hypothetical protein
MRANRAIRKTVTLATATMVGASIVVEANNPHVEQREFEEEPQMTHDSPHSTTSMTMLYHCPFEFELMVYGPKPQVKVSKPRLNSVGSAYSSLHLSKPVINPRATDGPVPFQAFEGTEFRTERERLDAYSRRVPRLHALRLPRVTFLSSRRPYRATISYTRRTRAIFRT